MTIPLRRRSLLMAGLLAGTLLVAMPGALAQNPEPPQSDSGSLSPQRPNGNAASQSEIGPYTYSPSPEDYYGWIVPVGREDAAIRRAVAEGNEKIPAPDQYTKLIGISEIEEQPLRSIALTAYEQLTAVEASYRTEMLGCAPHCPPTKLADLDALMKQRKDILDEAVAQVRRELNEADYTKFSDWVCHRCVERQRIMDRSAPKQLATPPQEQK